MTEDLTRLSLDDLRAKLAAAEDVAKEARAEVSDVKAECARRYGESARQALAQLDKEYGTVTLPLQDGFRAKAEVKQTVKWDSDELQAIASTMPWERVREIFKISFAVPEKIYGGLRAANPELADRIDAARTTTIGEPVVTILKDA